jgi:hypothetical protein
MWPPVAVGNGDGGGDSKPRALIPCCRVNEDDEVVPMVVTVELGGGAVKSSSLAALIR